MTATLVIEVDIHHLRNEVLLINLRMGCGDLTQTSELGNPHGMMDIVGAVVGAQSKHNLGMVSENFNWIQIDVSS